jgi:hypothetical protein
MNPAELRRCHLAHIGEIDDSILRVGAIEFIFKFATPREQVGCHL